MALASDSPLPLRLMRAVDSIDRPLAVTCSQASDPQRRDEVQVRCFADFGPDMYASLAARVNGGVTIVRGRCETCPLLANDDDRQPGEEPAVPEVTGSAVQALIDRRVTYANRLLERSGRDDTRATVVVHDAAEAGVGGTGLRQRLRNAFSRRETHVVHAGPTRRDLILGLRGTSEERLVAPAVTTERGALLAAIREPILSHPVVVGSCTACDACVRTCPTSALHLTRGSGMATLRVAPESCVACMECVEICPENCLDMSGASAPGDVVIGTSVAARCERCGRELHPGESELCQACRSSGDLLANVRRQRG